MRAGFILRSRACMSSVLKCDPSAIQFLKDSPQISCKTTLDALNTAAQHLTITRKPVAFPTETVYGLGALALDAAAAKQIFQVKGRPADNPLIVHVSSKTMLQSLLPPSFVFSRTYEILMTRFWPGPLTLLFPASPDVVPPLVTAKHPTVAVRQPAHPVARALIALANAPLAAPSANSSGKPSPTKAEHVLHDLDGKISYILDGGACDVGVESTVIDGLHEDGHIRVLRPGGVTVEDLEKAFIDMIDIPEQRPRVLVHRRDYNDKQMEAAPTTPGMKYTHYSPTVPVELVMTLSSPSSSPHPRITGQQYLDSLQERFRSLGRKPKLGILAPSDGILAHSDLHSSSHFIPLGATHRPGDIARGLFDGLLSLDREKVDLILIEEVAETEEGLAVMNRVKKAASTVVWVGFS